MGIAHLDHHTGVLSEEGLHDVAILTDVVEVDMHTALRVGEAHLQEGGDQTTGRDVVTGHDPPLLDELLDGHEGIAEVFGVLHRWYVVAYLT